MRSVRGSAQFPENRRRLDKKVFCAPEFFLIIPIVCEAGASVSRSAVTFGWGSTMYQLVGDSIRERMDAVPPREPSVDGVDLPHHLKPDAPARTAILRRLGASARFAWGERSGVLRTAQRRSGRRFRLDIRQRVVVKALVSRHTGAKARGLALLKHASYLNRAGAGVEGGRPDFFNREAEGLDAGAIVRGWTDDRHHFRFIISPEHGDHIQNFPAYVREVMGLVADDLGQPYLQWVATAHFDTDQPHAHVLVRGRRGNDRDLVIPRDYIAYGLRARAQEVAQELLGDLSRHEVERRIRREAEENRFTGLDKRLVASAARDGTVSDGVGQGAWPALMRGRLRYLERVGLIRPEGPRYRLAGDLELRLRTLQLRQDVLRTLNQRRLEYGVEVREFAGEPIAGHVVQVGWHDEAGLRSFVLVRDSRGVEHYTAVRAGTLLPTVGQAVSLTTRGDGVLLALRRNAMQDLAH